MALPCWYAVTTQPRHEKAVTDHLRAKCVEVYLPLTERVSHWKDRTVKIQWPAFPGYVFTRIDLKDRHLIYATPGILRMLSFNGVPAVIDHREIHAVQVCLSHGENPEIHPYIEAGRRVRVKAGSLAGVEGTILRQKNASRIIVSISMIHQSVSVEIESRFLEEIPDTVSQMASIA